MADQVNMKITLVKEEKIHITLNDLLEKMKDGKFSWDGKDYMILDVSLNRLDGVIRIMEVK